MIKNIKIGRDAYEQIMYYVHKAKFEISGLGNVRIINGVATVTDIFLIDQENDPTETEMKADAIGKCIYDHHMSGIEGDLKFWWHSHVDMQVFWSGTDRKTIEELTENGWFIHGVFNKKNEHRICYSNNEPFEVFVDNLELDIDESFMSEEKRKLYEMIDNLDNNMFLECDELFKEKVTDKVRPVYPISNGYKYNEHNWNQRNEVDKGKSQVSSMTMTEIYQASSVIPTTGDVKNDFDDLVDIDGATELFHLGLTIPEMIHLQDWYNVTDKYDLDIFEERYGDLCLALEDDDFYADNKRGDYGQKIG